MHKSLNKTGQMQPGAAALFDIIGYSMYVELHLGRLTPGI